ncbi:MAG: hypothetical protein JWN98_1421 [Abditibacteriota bacterium]|nr:hypothetical protein [Abditibacteriota bacterium]
MRTALMLFPVSGSLLLMALMACAAGPQAQEESTTSALQTNAAKSAATKAEAAAVKKVAVAGKIVV